MRPTEIRRHIRRPFVPIRIHISDGSAYEVLEPEYVYLDQRELAIGIDIDDSGIPERSVYVDPVHVTRIEPLAQSNGQRE